VSRPCRRLQIEGLECRRVLATDGLWLHNPGNPEDTNQDGIVSPGDALIVVNRLNGSNGEDSGARFLPDVDGDGSFSPRDALLIINRLNSRSRESGVTPGERAARLRPAIESGRLPPHLSPEEAREMLATLERGGRWELGERFRDGRLVNLGAEREELLSDEDETSAPVITNPIEPDEFSVGQDDPVEQLAPEPEDLRDDEIAPVLPPLNTVFSRVDRFRDGSAEVEDAREQSTDTLRTELAQRLREAAEQEDLPAWIQPDRLRRLAATIENSESPIRDIVAQLREAYAEHAEWAGRIARIFSRLDVDAIVEQLRVDLSTLLAAHAGRRPATEREAIFAEFVRAAAVSLF